jgi:hypothetical protein
MAGDYHDGNVDILNFCTVAHINITGGINRVKAVQRALRLSFSPQPTDFVYSGSLKCYNLWHLR